MTIDTEKLKAMAIERDRRGFQLAFHAIGDKANHVALDVFESVQRVNPERDRRDRIEHAQVVAADDIARFGKLNVIASMQPSHETNDMRWAERTDRGGEGEGRLRLELAEEERGEIGVRDGLSGGVD